MISHAVPAPREFPLVSVITVNFNNCDGLRSTIESVARQSFQDRELVIVDGGSADGSGELIRELQNHIQKAISEPDEGIYHAMNKGVRLASGEWIIFMNSGDVFADNDVLSEISEVLRKTSSSIVYGDSIVKYDDGVTRFRQAAQISRLSYGMPCSHQSMLTRRELNLSLPFTVKHILEAPACDYELFVAASSKGHDAERVSRVVAQITAGGVSDRKRLAVLRHYTKILHEHGRLTCRLRFYFAYQRLRSVLMRFAHKFLPSAVLRFLRRVRYTDTLNK